MLRHSLPILLAALALACSESTVAPFTESYLVEGLVEAESDQPLHRVIAGGPDVCLPGLSGQSCPASSPGSFSLVATQFADGSVEGKWQWGGHGVSLDVNCLLVIGNQAWIGGVIVRSENPGAIGLEFLVTVQDNGTSANEAPDAISLRRLGAANECLSAPGFPELIPIPQGQVAVQ